MSLSDAAVLSLSKAGTPVIEPILMRVHALVVAVSALLFASPAFAYIDPGSGAYVVQTLIALGGSVVLFLSRPGDIVRKIKEKFRKSKHPR